LLYRNLKVLWHSQLWQMLRVQRKHFP